jgi:hypothetical protein
MGPTGLDRDLPRRKRKMRQKSCRIPKTPQYYLGGTVANEIELVKCYVGGARRLPSVWTATPCHGKIFELGDENSTPAAARVTIIFTKMKARYVVAESGKILGGC